MNGAILRSISAALKRPGRETGPFAVAADAAQPSDSGLILCLTISSSKSWNGAGNPRAAEAFSAIVEALELRPGLVRYFYFQHSTTG